MRKIAKNAIHVDSLMKEYHKLKKRLSRLPNYSLGFVNRSLKESS